MWTVDVDGENTTEDCQRGRSHDHTRRILVSDGKQIAVILFDWQLDEKGEQALGGSDDHHFRIEIMDADGTNRRQLDRDDMLV